MNADLLARLADVEVLVVGDAILDRYLLGSASRISPEAPVPVVLLREERFVPGGAANVACGVAALGGKVTFAGAVGDDPWADHLSSRLHETPNLTTQLWRSKTWSTIVKTRVIADAQQVVRIDREKVVPLPQEIEREVIGFISRAIAGGAQVCVLSDYAKGLLSEAVIAHAIQTCRAAKVPVVIDPKARDFRRYRGATVVTPNSSEALGSLQAEGDPDLDAISPRILDALGGAALLVTLGADGFALYRPTGERLRVRSQDHPVFDRIGAGDTFAATLALCLGAGIALETAARIANCAAGLAVRKLGTATIAASELKAELLAEQLIFTD